MKKLIEDRLHIMQEVYKKDTPRIDSDYNKEQEALQSYHGRELLELLQNADDELRDDMPKEISISFQNDTLVIANYGDPFDEEGIISLMYSNVSGKQHRKKPVIGNKGTGFRAILGWAKEVSIDSADLHVRFSEEHSQSVLRELFKDNKEKITGKKAATLVFPEWIDNGIKSSYTTVISIKIKDDDAVRENIRTQIHSLNAELLLFMNRTQTLVINLDSQEIKYEKKNDKNNKVKLKKYIDGQIIYDKNWLLNSKSGVILTDGEEKNYSIITAYDCDDEIPTNQVLYSYFPTDVRFPFPVLLHANFELNADRNHLIKESSANKEILIQAADLLIDTAKKIKGGKFSYDIIKFLIPMEKLQTELSSYDFDKFLKEKIKSSNIFPTVNKKYVSFSKTLAFYSEPLAKYLTGDGFDNLLMYIEDPSIREFIRSLEPTRWHPDYAIERINAWVKRHKATEEHIRHVAFTAIAFLEVYEGENYSIKPSFFYNQEGELIEKDRPMFYMPEDIEITKPPEFVEVDFLLPYMKNYICKKLRKDYESESDVLERLGNYNIKEYSPEELLDYLRELFSKDSKTLKKSQINKRWEQMIVWLWGNRKIIFTDDRTIAFYLKNRKNDYILSTETYAGEEYNNKLGEKLFGKAFPDKMICNLKKYILNEDNLEIEEFLKHLGVSFMPIIKAKDQTYGSKSYPQKVFNVLKFPYKIDGAVFDSAQDMINRSWKIVIRHDYIDGLDTILNVCDTADILEWVYNDAGVKQLLTTHQTTFASRVDFAWDLKQNTRKIEEIKKPYSYILHQFQTIPWIQVGDGRYKVSDCVLSNDKIENLSPAIVEPELSEYLKNVDGQRKKLRADYISLLNSIGVANDFAELPVDKIYEVLALLSERENTESLAKSFYQALLRSKKELSESDLKCKNYVEFINNGKVLCTNGYIPIKDAYYLDGKDICNKIAKTFNLICLPKRLNSKRIETFLGVKKLVLKNKLVGIPTIHDENANFKKDFKAFLPLAFVYRMDSKEEIKKEARRFATIDISICSEIGVNYNGDKIELDDYEYILEGAHTYFLKVPSNFNKDNMRHNVPLATAIANIFSSYLDVNDVLPQIRELYSAGTNKDREFLINQEFEDENIITKAKQLLNINEDLRDEFIGIVSHLSGKKDDDFKYLIDDIDFDKFSDICNAMPIIKLFKALEIDVADYNDESPSIDIDLRPYYDAEIYNKLPYYKDQYEWTHYERLKDASLGDKKSLVANFLAIEDAKITTDNSIYFDCHKAIISQLHIHEGITGINLKKKYEREMSKLKARINNADYLYEFFQYTDNMSLLYYGEIDELVKLYTVFQEKKAADNAEISCDIPNRIPSIIYMPDTKPGNGEEIKSSYHGKSKKRKTGFLKLTTGEEQEKIGLLGERLVYNMLIKNHELERVDWVSENAKKDNGNPAGTAGKGYDIEYIDSSKMRKYIEVKTSKAQKSEGIRFFFSDNEYKFASEHAENYCVYYVCEIMSSNPKVFVLDNIFVGDDFNEDKYHIESSSQYVITAEFNI